MNQGTTWRWRCSKVNLMVWNLFLAWFPEEATPESIEVWIDLGRTEDCLPRICVCWELFLFKEITSNLRGAFENFRLRGLLPTFGSSCELNCCRGLLELVLWGISSELLFYWDCLRAATGLKELIFLCLLFRFFCIIFAIYLGDDWFWPSWAPSSSVISI